MTLYAHNQILPLSLVIGLSLIAMIWVTNTSLDRQPAMVSKMASIMPHQQVANVETTNCYKYLRTARSAGSSYWWQKYKSCIAAI